MRRADPFVYYPGGFCHQRFISITSPPYRVQRQDTRLYSSPYEPLIHPFLTDDSKFACLGLERTRYWP